MYDILTRHLCWSHKYLSLHHEIFHSQLNVLRREKQYLEECGRIQYPLIVKQGADHSGLAVKGMNCLHSLGS
jgi:hypothetical protein